MESKFFENSWPALLILEDGRHFLIHKDGTEEEVQPDDPRLEIRYETFIKQPKI